MFSDDILTMLRHHTSLTAVFIMFFHDRFLQYVRITADRTATARYVAFLRVLEFYSATSGYTALDILPYRINAFRIADDVKKCFIYQLLE